MQRNAKSVGLRASCLLAALASALAGCSDIPSGAYYNRAAPESLLDVSSEAVNFQIGGPDSAQEVADWVNQDQPTRAELYCAESDPACAKTREVLEQFGVPVVFAGSAENTVTLIYERVMGRDCENRFIDNTVNPYNLNHPTFGCSIASNMAQMITDKQQVISPALLEYTDGQKTQQAMEAYATPPNVKAPEIDTNFDTQFETSE